MVATADPGTTEDEVLFRPWGGGATMCAGRDVARGVVCAFVAMMVDRFEMAVVRGQVVPRREGSGRLGVGVLGPVGGDDLMVTVMGRGGGGDGDGRLSG